MLKLKLSCSVPPPHPHSPTTLLGNNQKRTTKLHLTSLECPVFACGKDSTTPSAIEFGLFKIVNLSSVRYNVLKQANSGIVDLFHNNYISAKRNNHPKIRMLEH